MEESSPDLVERVREIFSPTGLLSKSRTFEYREEQQKMAVAVAEALQSTRHLVVEAGTGVGKSLGYLIPSILYAVEANKRAIVSTHTINLQEQLIYKDLPMLQDRLPVKFKFGMLKGRHNYLCRRRLAKARQQAASLFSTPESVELERIAKWAQETEDGSLSDFEQEPDPKVWGLVCSERGNCSPKLCGPQSDFGQQYGECFYQKARARVLGSDVIVLNHTLLFTLLSMTEDKLEDAILLKRDFLIVDEAHTMESVAAKHIGVHVSYGQIRFLLHRLWNPGTGKGLFGLLKMENPKEVVAKLLEANDLFFTQVEEVCQELHQNSGRKGEERREWGEVRFRRPGLVSDEFSSQLGRLRETLVNVVQMVEDKDLAQEFQEQNQRLQEIQEALRHFLYQPLEGQVYWVDRVGKTPLALGLNAAPYEVASYLNHRFFQKRTSVIMASATLSIEGCDAGKPGSGMEYFLNRVGVQGADLLQLGSPFDYPNQMKLCLVREMPPPKDPKYQESLIHWIQHFIKRTHGKAFVLFTSYRLMKEVADALEPFFESLDLNCYVQGAGIPRSLMLEKFKEEVDSVLFGTDSFWQGVDVPGEALSNVIITRLPFSVPDHPLIEAKVEAIEARGGNAFKEFSMPEAILKFRQGVGRLIRKKTDTGIVVILDNRVMNQWYGGAFLKAMPECPTEVV